MPSALARFLRRSSAASALLFLFAGTGSAAIQEAARESAVAPVSIDFGGVPVGSAVKRSGIPVRFSKSGQIERVRGLLMGAENLDYKVSRDSCSPGTVFQVGDTCNVNVEFQPLYPGPRHGAVVVTDASGATLATTYLTGIGQGALATFPNAAPLPITDDVGFFSGYTVDGKGNVYYLNDAGAQTQIIRVSRAGARSVFTTIPTGFEDVTLATIDGAGNLVLTAALEKRSKVHAEVLKVDGAGNVTRLATVRPQPPLYRPVALGGAAVLGSGDVLVGSGARPGEEVFLFVVHPNGSVHARFGLQEMYADSFVSDVAVAPSGTIYEGSYGWVYQNTKQLFRNAYIDGLAVDASGTLLTGSEQGYLGIPQPCPTPTIPGGCPANPAPPVNELPFKFPVLDAQGDAYVVYFADPTSPLYKLVRTQPSGVVFSSPGNGTSYGSFAITNSGNQPLDLSSLDPVLSGAFPQAFHIERDTCGSSLEPAATCSLSLSYTPGRQFPGLPTGASLLLGGLRSTRVVVPLEGFPNQ